MDTPHARTSLLGTYVVALATLLVATATQVHAARPIEAIVAPAALFGPEEEASGATSALPAFDRPGGKRIGEVSATPAPCEHETDKTPCPWPPSHYFLTTSGEKGGLVATAEWSYEQRGLITYTRPRVIGGRAWAAIEVGRLTVWVRSRPDEVHEFERLAHVVENPSVLCSSPGRGCAAPTAAERQEMARLAPLVSCFDSPYTITNVVKHGGRRYYRLEIHNLDGQPTSLRQPVYVPTRGAGNQHTGTLYSRGC